MGVYRTDNKKIEKRQKSKKWKKNWEKMKKFKIQNELNYSIRVGRHRNDD